MRKRRQIPNRRKYQKSHSFNISIVIRPKVLVHRDFKGSYNSSSSVVLRSPSCCTKKPVKEPFFTRQSRKTRIPTIQGIPIRTPYICLALMNRVTEDVVRTVEKSQCNRHSSGFRNLGQCFGKLSTRGFVYTISALYQK